MNYDFSSQQHQRHDNFDPYEALNIQRDSDIEQVRAAFRKLTRVHHPDRNRGNPQYNPVYYSKICAAYEILSDPRQRTAFDEQHAPTWNSLKDNAKLVPKVARHAEFSTKDKFTSNDQKAFNTAFEKTRKATANDRGYGNMMAERATEADIKRGRTIEPTQNVFGSSSVGEKAFNQRFETELKAKRQQQGQGNIMERNNEPQGWGANGAAFSEVSVFDGIIVDKETDNFNKEDVSGGLNYSDYMSGFGTILENIPEDHPYYSADGKNVEKVYNERLSQLTSVPDRGHNMSFSQAEQHLNQIRMSQIEDEQRRNREVVLKYRDQYTSDDLLPAPQQPYRVQENTPPQHRYNPQQRRPVQQQLPQQQAAYRPPPQQPFYQPPQQQQRAAAAQPPSRDFDAINNRMMDRQMDNFRRN